MPAASDSKTVNALTIDVEEYFQVYALSPYIERAEWDQRPSRVQRNLERILALLREHRARATFFTLGWIAERHREIVSLIAAEGHELASHGYAHRSAGGQTRAEFAEDIHRAKAILEDVSGVAVQGYRAPNFSIGASNDWAFDCIAAAGYRYSSSVYPVRHDHYGMPEAPRFAYQARPGLLELPVSTARVLGRNLPAGGGGYFRLLPYAVSRWLIRTVNTVDRKPAIFYFHPWEIDPGQPRVAGMAAKARFRHYVNLARTEPRLRRLLADFSWDRMDRVFLTATLRRTAPRRRSPR